MIKIIRVKLNVNMLHYKKGSILTLTNSKHSGSGIFISPYFKRRIEDSKIDNCLEILTTTGLKPLDSETKKELTKKPQESLDDNNYITVNRAEKSSLEGIKAAIAKPKKRGRSKTKKD